MTSGELVHGDGECSITIVKVRKNHDASRW